MFGCGECAWHCGYRARHYGYRWQHCCCYSYTGSASWFFGSLAAVLAFAVLVMLAVVSGCETQVATEPGVPGISTPVEAGDCAPFCGAVEDDAGSTETSPTGTF
ncbi:hypothetical protein JK358_15445 [Nocardia sp. 2]|uniref:Lipoprotein n=1 Tax=Nocardia acididurans TaxID=2802282 RepID=A0ABS1M6K9_9NOCA|nr:hypothetical protein [Nocardia acididurans]MBL1075790.1 hypothetical protein [Nocardia acididurans]